MAPSVKSCLVDEAGVFLAAVGRQSLQRRAVCASQQSVIHVELLQRDVDFRTAPIEHAIIESFDQYSVRANNLVAAKDFYGRRLGMSPLKQLFVEQSQLSIVYFTLKDDAVEMLHRPTPDTGHLFGHVALRVGNVDRALAHFAA